MTDICFWAITEKDDVRVFTVNQSETMIAYKEKMEALGYPAGVHGIRKQYKLFSLGAEITSHKKIDILKLKSEYDIKASDYAPFFVRY